MYFITEFLEGRYTGHVFLRGNKNRRCEGCYRKLRLTLNSTDASIRAKRIITYCAQCEQSICLTCFQ